MSARDMLAAETNAAAERIRREVAERRCSCADRDGAYPARTTKTHDGRRRCARCWGRA